MADHARKKKLIDSRFQLRLIGVFLCVSCVACLFQVVLLNKSMLGLSKRLAREGDLLLSQMPEVMTSNVLWTSSVLFPLTFLVGVLITHRIAGPAYRMREHCRRIARGERPEPCKIREYDELGDLCDALNGAFARLYADLDKAHSAIVVEELTTLVRETTAEVEEQEEEEAEASSSSEG